MIHFHDTSKGCPRYTCGTCKEMETQILVSSLIKGCLVLQKMAVRGGYYNFWPQPT